MHNQNSVPFHFGYLPVRNQIARRAIARKLRTGKVRTAFRKSPGLNGKLRLNPDVRR